MHVYRRYQSVSNWFQNQRSVAKKRKQDEDVTSVSLLSTAMSDYKLTTVISFRPTRIRHFRPLRALLIHLWRPQYRLLVDIHPYPLRCHGPTELVAHQVLLLQVLQLIAGLHLHVRRHIAMQIQPRALDVRGRNPINLRRLRNSSIEHQLRRSRNAVQLRLRLAWM